MTNLSQLSLKRSLWIITRIQISAENGSAYGADRLSSSSEEFFFVYFCKNAACFSLTWHDSNIDYLNLKCDDHFFVSIHHQIFDATCRHRMRVSGSVSQNNKRQRTRNERNIWSLPTMLIYIIKNIFRKIGNSLLRSFGHPGGRRVLILYKRWDNYWNRFWGVFDLPT